ncbi:MAG: hypothetical protein WD077_00980 [Bacteroidia bacterium]
MKNPKIQAVLLFVLVLMSRLPFLSSGFGMDPDSWNMALVARHIAETGHYVTSRLPGYPMPELLYAILPESYFIFNLISAVFSAVATVFFFLLLRHFRLPFPFLFALAFSFVPIIYINSVSSVDYMWAMAFILAGNYFAVKNEFLLAGLLLGISLSCRVTSVLMFVPLLLLIPRQPLRIYLKLCLAAAAGSLLYFIPVISTYGFNFLTYYTGPDIGLRRIVSMITQELWGRVGLVFLLAAVLWQVIIWLKKPETLKADNSQRRLLMAGGAGISLSFLLFLYLPHEAAYLIPTVVWIMLLLPLFLRRQVLLVVIAGCLISPVVTFGHTGIYKGPVLLNMEYREYHFRHFSTLLQKLSQVEKPVMLVAGWHEHALKFLNKIPDSELLIVYRVEADGKISHYHLEETITTVQEAERKGYRIFLLEQMQDEYEVDAPQPELIPLFPNHESE